MKWLPTTPVALIKIWKGNCAKIRCSQEVQQHLPRHHHFNSLITLIFLVPTVTLLPALRPLIPRTYTLRIATMRPPTALTIPAVTKHTATVIMAHGLGDSGAGWVSLAENWRRRSKFEEVKFIFPNAPTIPITVVCAAVLLLKTQD
jgi:hypothetical protein